jgi:tetrapyrrole methylase family protein / MazG family protein
MAARKKSSTKKSLKNLRRKAIKAVRPENKAYSPPLAAASFQKLVNVMARLRAPGGCPWDREQTHSSIRTYLIEEAYEVLDAIDSGDDKKFAEELGDLLLQVLFHSQMAGEASRFDILDVIRGIHDKMIRRHPHVFGRKYAKNSAEVLKNWEIIKMQERAASGAASATQETAVSHLDGVPRGLPALLEGYQLTKKAARIGFDWENAEGIFDKLQEEIRELREVIDSDEPARMEGELGDLLFVVVNLARSLKVDPEIAMKKSSAKFSRRFRAMEQLAREKGTTLSATPRRQMESLWDEVKRRENSPTPPAPSVKPR